MIQNSLKSRKLTKLLGGWYTKTRTTAVFVHIPLFHSPDHVQLFAERFVFVHSKPACEPVSCLSRFRLTYDRTEMTNGIENAKKDSFRCQEGSYVNRIVFVMASKLRKNCSFDAKFFLRVHRRRKTGVPVHIGWHRKCQKRQFSMPFSISNYFSGLWPDKNAPADRGVDCLGPSAAYCIRRSEQAMRRVPPGCCILLCHAALILLRVYVSSAFPV